VSLAIAGPRLGNPALIALGTGIAVAGVTLIASRAQLESGGPGLLSVTVPVPALLLFVVSLAAAIRSRSLTVGVRTGALAFIASFVAVVAVVAIEGFVWMNRHGVYALDADPPQDAATDLDIALDIFTTGTWVGHVVVWLAAVILGAALGAWIGQRRAN
jgi:hypothetical protein